MNKHRLYRRSKRDSFSAKKIQGKGFFKDLFVAAIKGAKPVLEDKTKRDSFSAKKIFHDKIEEILSKNKIGGGFKKYSK